MSEVGAVDALQVLARQRVELTSQLVHHEWYTLGGLFTVLWHGPSTGVRAAVVTGGGAMGGLLGPGGALFHRLGVELADQGIATLRIGYREPNDLDRCSHDLAAGVELAMAAGAKRVVTMGHSFGGAVAVRAAVVMPSVVGVVTFATQSAGCEVAGALGGRPLLLFHGDADELLPVDASEMVRVIAGVGEVVVLPGAGHLMRDFDDAIRARLDPWLDEVLGVPLLS